MAIIFLSSAPITPFPPFQSSAEVNLWTCKGCGVTKVRQSELLNHYKLQHSHFGRHRGYPCTYSSCPCSFTTWSSLKSHLSRSHPRLNPQKDEHTTLRCLLCEYKNNSTLSEYLQHLVQHLKNHETLNSIFQGCSYKTNVYGSFQTHRCRHHRLSHDQT